MFGMTNFIMGMISYKEIRFGNTVDEIIRYEGEKKSISP